MQVVIAILMFMIPSLCFSQSDEPDDTTYKAARKFGYSKIDIYKLNRQKRREIKSDGYMNDVAKALENDNIAAAQYADVALENLLSQAQGVLRNTGHNELADEIDIEFIMHYRNGFERLALGEKEIGDHPPMSKWLDSVHKRIEDAIGDFWCKFFHFHDIYILNQGFPVVWNPSKYDLKDYNDHFAGHPIFGFIFEHHGVAGVITYWIVQGVCSGATMGMGVVTFACGPISDLAEFIMDKKIAPPIAERIWKRAQN